MKVENELGVIVQFAQQCKEQGWEIVSIRSQFPDAIIKPFDADRVYLVEFEFLASDFMLHKHDLRECDIIVCWLNDWADCPITIWGLSEDGSWPNVENVTDEQIELYQLKQENTGLKKQIKKFASGIFEGVDTEDLDADSLTFSELLTFNALSKANGGICTRYKLKHELWEDAEVDNSRLEKVISRLRKKLVGSNFFICTIRGRGYKLIEKLPEMSASCQETIPESGILEA